MAKQGALSALANGGLSELWARLRFLFLAIVVYRIGAHIPVPGINPDRLAELFRQNEGTILSLFNMFSGGALERMSIFALGIMPYISASIIMQLMTAVSPQLEQLKKEGEAGRRKISQYTRYGTLALAIVQAVGMSVGLAGQGVAFSSDFGFYFVAVTTFVAGAMFMMWLGEQITERGIGNGMSMLIFISIIASFPGALWSIAKGNGGLGKFVVVVLVALLVIALVVFVEQSQRRIPVQYAKRMVGRRVYGGSTTYIPIKINMAGVIPVIFASSLLSVPMLIAQFANIDAGWVRWVQVHIADPSAPLHLVLYVLLILFFCFFYTAITFNPDEVADNMKKYGGFIPGIRAGRPTADYLNFVITRITSAGSIYLALVALIPTVAFIAMGVSTNIPFGGTSILIIVGVGLETVKQIDSQLQQRHYEGLLK